MRKKEEDLFKHVLSQVLAIHRPKSNFNFAERQIVCQYFLENKSIAEIAREGGRQENYVKEIRRHARQKIDFLLNGLIFDLKEAVSLHKERDLLQAKVLTLEEENKNLRFKLGRKLIKKGKFEIEKNLTIGELYELKMLSQKNFWILDANDYRTVERLKQCGQKELLNLKGFGKVGLRQVEKIIGFSLPKK
ncbi:MAG TPA: hypothetical protein VJ103_01235 [Candidatus Paceibacterota bacterium]|nr:hypothetical protein [Candidatus Paceibacterota bacterium]